MQDLVAGQSAMAHADGIRADLMTLPLFYRRFYLTGSGTFENSGYFANVPQASAARNSNYVSGSIGVDYYVREGWTVGAFYLNRQSSGNAAAAPYDFIDHQVGVRSTISF